MNKVIVISKLKPGSSMLFEAEDDNVYELIKLKKGWHLIGGRKYQKPVKVRLMTRKMKRGEPIKYKLGDEDLFTEKVVSAKINLVNQTSVEVWEDAINENFGPG